MNADRVYPNSKPTTMNPTVNGNATTTTTPLFPAPKSQQYGASRPAYRPQPKRRSRSRCCCCFLWSTMIIIALILLAAIAGGVMYVLYRPHRPTFNLTTLRISQFNVTTNSKDSTNHLASKLDLAITSRNPNKRITFTYDPISVTVKSNDVNVGVGSFPSFVHGTKNTTVLKATLANNGDSIEGSSLTKLKTDMKKKTGLPLEIEMETKVKVNIGGMKTSRFGIRVSCIGIHAVITTTTTKGKNSTTTATTSTLSGSSKPECKVNLRIKIWKWTF
ncbi:hypothetical protein MKW98_020904 [Papaver atlanticum]|uniref:Late embryogenesis abundant protein LEA-2 subgroup domain-containing protein n=1 Tax=Papaver atlanticum TaxID=357466 RepID=A0AAD4TDH5_9MAGN|nr:hypothetical protein MKW98_020904 [Papaver atlanticum]